ncbi:hypothetical protein CEUSTIGMA_g6696.t1 [Chlamydomonas eustigma]|uniref:Pseudouridine synthase RsuA/RluA-like domain-containing protein n=1 Tax=Chlamydomonas eustigma TaxID=1157962 RepID=A0A250X874_9CHLO|nr:hypothetical protein CEUSTIGMA_g6696.t1 [Chlamydomonas eustigma]|eukprot:GAX79256.1 hypothetical protein CEUSTIGMA_g6696.t1 [Chlamydomonas eustigma]
MKVSEEKKPGAGVLTENNETKILPENYVFIDNLRLVKPYYFDFKCYVKQRWEGLSLIQLFSKEFPMLTEEYYRRAFAAGRLRVEGQPTFGADQPLQTSMCIRHLIHRHEPPVLTGSVEVLKETEDFLAVSKPACMPVHTVGQYRKNTVLGVLEAERPDLGTLYPTYRLDKPVSGLLLLAKSSSVAGNMRKLLEERTCNKVYIARVMGIFPGSPSSASQVEKSSHSEQNAQATTSFPIGELVSTANDSADSGPAAQDCLCENIALASNLYGVTTLEDGWVEVDVPLSWDGRTNHALPVVPGGGARGNEHSDGKSAITHFRVVSVAADGSTSVVECKPKTGRTHQIRVHLQYMGHPIANDTQYGGKLGPPLAFRRLYERTSGASEETGQAIPKLEFKRPRLEEKGASCKGNTLETCNQSLQPQSAREEVCQAEDLEPSRASTHFYSSEGSSDIVIDKAAAAPPDSDTKGNYAIGPSQPELFAAFDLNNPGTLNPAGPTLPETIQMLYSRECYRVSPELQEAVCPHCPCLVPFGYPIDLEPMWLHALAYSGPDFSFEAPFPEWGHPEFRVPERRKRLKQDDI